MHASKLRGIELGLQLSESVVYQYLAVAQDREDQLMFGLKCLNLRHRHNADSMGMVTDDSLSISRAHSCECFSNAAILFRHFGQCRRIGLQKFLGSCQSPT